jgi:hypothetical protein
MEFPIIGRLTDERLWRGDGRRQVGTFAMSFEPIEQRASGIYESLRLPVCGSQLVLNTPHIRQETGEYICFVNSGFDKRRTYSLGVSGVVGE